MTTKPLATTAPERKEQHTPGPWKVQGIGTCIGTEGDPYGCGHMHVADVRGWGHLTGQGACRYSENKAIAIQTANASLIAAAPELLEACRLALKSGAEDLDEAERRRDVCRAAIAKAEGR